MKLIIFILYILVFLPSSSVAEWYLDINGPDVFGEKSASVTADFIGNTDLIRMQCKSNGDYSFSWLIKTNEPMPNVRSLTGDILMKGDMGASGQVSAKLLAWNEKYIALSSFNDPIIIKLLDGIASSQSKINFGYLIPEIDAKASGTSLAINANFATGKFKSHCGL